MRVWNLSEPDALNDVVVEELTSSRRAQPRARTATAFQSVKSIVGVASVMFTISFSSLTVNHGSVRLPSWESAIIKSIPDLKAPLEEIFGNRFNSEWTQEIENSLLGQIVEKRFSGGPAPDQVAAFIHSNLQEDITLDRPRLSSATLAKSIRK